VISITYETASSTRYSAAIAYFECDVVPPRVSREQRERPVVGHPPPHQPTLAQRPGVASNQFDSQHRSVMPTASLARVRALYPNSIHLSSACQEAQRV
jgi:hypothetical protein